MIFQKTKLKGAYRIEIEPIQDERGFFSQTYCRKEFKRHGLDFIIVQSNLSFNSKKGTLRGLHYQAAPYEEAKLVACLRGKIFDVIVDLRPHSATYRQWLAFELDEISRTMLYVPKGFAHGFQTLEPNTLVSYQMSEYYQPESAQGIKWNDPVLSIQWPKTKHRIISQKDQQYPDLI